DLLRKIILRPLPQDHFTDVDGDGTWDIGEPRFSGSNPSFNPITGPWDVDNDGDGTPDSIWVDLGLPVQSTSDGRTYKPLFAILCVDMDGKLNLNAHGNIAHIYPPGPITGAIAGLPPAGTTAPYGQGFGPAEVSLAPALGNILMQYTRLLFGDTSQLL